jgi:hypothetical protein
MSQRKSRKGTRAHNHVPWGGGFAWERTEGRETGVILEILGSKLAVIPSFSISNRAMTLAAAKSQRGRERVGT